MTVIAKSHLAPALAFMLSAAAGLSLGLAALAQPPAGQAPPGRGPRPVVNNPPPVVSGAHWHDVTLNVADPKKSVEFYTTHFDAKPAKWNGQDAVWVQKSWILLNKTAKRDATRFNTAIWHIGWGAEDPKREYLRQQGLKAVFFTPVTDIALNNGGTIDRFFYMYVQGPDRDLVELNTANHHHFGHIHMFSEDPIAAGDWWIKTFGLTGRALSTPSTPSREPRFGKNGNQIGPSSSLYLDNVNIIIYPMGYSRHAYPDDWKASNQPITTRGHLHDHIGIAVPDLQAAIAQLDKAGVKLTEPVKSLYGGQVKTAYIEGPDKVAIQLIEDHSPHPPETE